MNYLIKLLIPLALGALAAFINFQVLATSTAKVEFVTVAKDVPRNEPFDLANAEKLSLPPDFRELSKTLVPWSERGVLSGKPVRRTIKQGDPVFFSDTDLEGEWLELEPGEKLFPVELGEAAIDPSLIRIGNEIQFRIASTIGNAEPRWIGPYRIVAVGARSSNDDASDSTRGIRGLNIGIAYNIRDENMKASLKDLEEFCDAQKQGTSMMLGVLIDEKKGGKK